MLKGGENGRKGKMGGLHTMHAGCTNNHDKAKHLWSQGKIFIKPINTINISVF